MDDDSQQHAYRSYALAAEDLMAARYFPHGFVGTYVDVGCWKPIEGSNTYYFYERGWRGLGIDAGDYADAWTAARPGDVFVQSGVGIERGNLTYYMFPKDTSCNTMDAQMADMWKQQGYECLVQSVPVQRLNDILTQHGVKQIDFLSIDIEGFDRAIVEDFDWGRWKPRVVAVENLQIDMHHAFMDSMVAHMEKQGYLLHAKSFFSLIFVQPRSEGEVAHLRQVVANRKRLIGG